MNISANFSSFIEWIKSVWNKVNIKEWSENIGGSSAEAIQAAIYFCLSFAIGFLFKKYFKIVFLSLFFAGFIILLLEYNKIVTIDWVAFKALLGLDATADFGVMINSFFEWAKNHLVISISCAVGFLVGYRLG